MHIPKIATPRESLHRHFLQVVVLYMSNNWEEGWVEYRAVDVNEEPTIPGCPRMKLERKA